MPSVGLTGQFQEKVSFFSPRIRPILPERENREIVDDHMQLASRLKAADKIITQISVGMQRRVAVPRAGGSPTVRAPSTRERRHDCPEGLLSYRVGQCKSQQPTTYAAIKKLPACREL